MDTNTAPCPALPADVEQRIRNYRPRALTADQWAGCRESVEALVAAAPPADAADARDLLTSSVALIVWAQPKAGTSDLSKLLAGPWISRFAAQWRREGRPDNTLRNHLARLHRLQRTAAGGDGSRTIRRIDREAPRTARPYGDVERTALLTAAQVAPVTIGETIRLALRLADAGVVVPDAYEHGLTRDGWQTARDWVKAHRLPGLDGLELRRMWALRVASAGSLLDVLAAGVTRNELDGLRPHLPQGEPADTHARLRIF